MDRTLGRRDFLKISAGVLAGIGTLGLTGCGGASIAGNGTIALQFTFWGSTTRASRTNKAVQLYQQLYPHTTIATQFTDFNSYWPKLATQISGGSAPDLIQMDMRYIDQYVKKGLLLDLSKFLPQPIDLHDFNQVLLKGSEAEGVVYGIPFGGNFLGILYDKNMLEKAGVEMPEQAQVTGGRHLDRVFRQHFATSIHQKLLHLRIDAARELLVQGKPLKQIASQMCFHDYRYFLKVFKRMHGVSPGELQRTQVLPHREGRKT